MCGRFTLASKSKSIAEYFGIDLSYELTPRYNIAPSQDVLVIRQSTEYKPEFCLMRWGLVPAWQKEEEINTQWINARSETINEKPLFKNLFRHKRCLIIADGFYEWQTTSQGKRPYYIYKNNHQPFAIAGLWEHWEGKDGKSIDSCLLLTTEANLEVKEIHHRMPVILQKSQFPSWLNPQNNEIAMLKSFMQPYLPPDLVSHEISTYVNSPKNDDEQCIAEI